MERQQWWVRISTLSLVVLSLVIVVGGTAMAAYMASDVTPPYLVAFDFEPKAVDTTLSGQTITFTVHITDDLSGVHTGPGSTSHVWFESPSGNQYASATLDPARYLVSGTPQNGVYVTSFDLPQYSETGTWRLDHVALVDQVGNERRLYYDDVVAMGFAVDLVVASTVSDTDPPHLAAFDFEPRVVNTALSGQTVTFTVHITDDLSGVHTGPGPNAHIWFESPSGNQYASAVLDPARCLVYGTSQDGVYVTSFDLPQYCETGNWRLAYVALVDQVGNERRLDYEDMIAMGFGAELLVRDDLYRTFLSVVMAWREQ